MSNHLRRGSAVPVLAILLMAGVAVAQGNPTGTAWIDAPLSWEVVTSVPVPVVAHAAHPTGVFQVRLDVNGQTAAIVDTAGNTLEAAEFSWNPPGSGVYLLEVFSGSGASGWGLPGVVEVSVDLGGESTTTTATTSTTQATTTTTTTQPVPTTTTTTTPSTTTTLPVPTTTPPSTTTTTFCGLAVPAPAGASLTSTLSPILNWSYAGCREPEEFEIQVSRTNDFLRSEWLGSVAGDQRSTSVSVGADCTTYYWRIRTFDLGSQGPWSSAASFFIQTGRSCP